ncbi:MAG: 1-acyl-sn-glycerol-3-phosphate acyltransferase [Clostridia bacterium]|nr:1-acyl-sn-glycerol-3-phosphate acyltransferase [Clostridia bacterium]
MEESVSVPKRTKKRWTRRRHKWIRNLLYPFLYPVCRLKYGAKIKKFKEQGDRQYLILFNHQTLFDQFFVSAAFKGAVYYLASEDILSNGFVSKLISFLAAPIPIRKQTGDFSAVLNCLRVAKEGGTLAMAPEGQRTYSGKTAYIHPSVVPFVRKLRLPVVLFRIEGGYGVQPRWSDAVRKGKMRAYASRVLEPEEYERYDDKRLYEEICAGLFQDENCLSGRFEGKKLAEHLERAIYVCPTCGFSHFTSRGDLITCRSCGKSARLLPTKELEGVGHTLPFRFVGDWYAYEERYLINTDLSAYTDTPVFVDEAEVRKVILCKKKERLTKKARVCLYADRVTVESDGFNAVFPFSVNGALTVLGNNKLNIYQKENVFQIVGRKSFNALKYVHVYNKFKNEEIGEKHGEFLGL